MEISYKRVNLRHVPVELRFKLTLLEIKELESAIPSDPGALGEFKNTLKNILNDNSLVLSDIELSKKIDENNKLRELLDSESSVITARDIALTEKETQLNVKEENINLKIIENNTINAELDSRETELNDKETELNTRESELNAREEELNIREEALNELEVVEPPQGQP